jgi:2,3-bisphosphoglycerate-independent phosphoglycerate mutase
VLDELAAEGSVVRVAVTPAGLPAGSETGISALLGAAPREPLGRGWVDAAAYEVEVPDGLTPWRADLVYRNGRRASVRQARDVCSHLGPGARAVGGHRLLLISARQPPDRRLLGLHVRVWPHGSPPAGAAAEGTTVVCARGAAAGCGRLLGADVVVPERATGDVDTDLRAKAQAAVAAMAGGARRVVVHAGGADEAAHRREPGAVVAFVERLDAELLAPLRDATSALGGRLAICPDHGTDPATGEHDAAPVPAVRWGEDVPRGGPARMHERAALAAGVVAPAELLPGPLVVA